MVKHSFICAILPFISVSTALVARASLPPSFSVQYLGQTTEADSAYDGVYRDGGGGGTINGNNLVVFCDTGTTKDGNLIGFTSNSIAYSSASDPTVLTDFGSNGVPDLGIPWLANETAQSDEYNQDGGRMIIWPGSSIAVLPDGVSGIAVYEVVHLYSDFSTAYQYSTMVQYQPTSSGPNASRIVPSLFYPGEVGYGSFGARITHTGEWVLLFGKDGDGIKLARVKPSSVSDRSQYQYFDGTEWTSTPATPGDMSANIFSGSISSGDFFYSPYLGTWVFIYFDGWADNKFLLSYSTSGLPRGPYSDPVTLCTTTPYSGKYNYAGHAYPDLDPTGKTVLLSWTYDGADTMMAEVTFA